MAISAKMDTHQQTLIINIIGRFDFNSHNDFRQSYENLPEPPQRVLINMKQATFIDSSALGMLLILRDLAGGDSANIEIVDCNDEVREILNMANFNNLFSIK